MYCFQIGDGDIVYIDRNGFRSVMDSDKILGIETYSLSNEKPWEHAKSHFQRIDLENKATCMFMMTTDGFFNSFLDDEQYRISCMDYYKTICDFGSDQVQKNLASWLEQTSEEGCGDDITLVAIGFIEEEKCVDIEAQDNFECNELCD